MNLGLDFFEASGLSREVPNERNVLAANLERTENFDLRDSGGVDGEDFLHADTVNVFANGDGFRKRGGSLGANDETAELLDAGFFAFFDHLVDFYLHSGTHPRHVGLHERCLDFADERCVRHIRKR